MLSAPLLEGINFVTADYQPFTAFSSSLFCTLLLNVADFSAPASATNILLSRCNSAEWRISQFIEGTKVEIFLPHVYVGYHSLRDEE